MHGSPGLTGSYGVLRLIQGSEALPKATGSVSFKLVEANGKSAKLDEHVWERRSGATALLAPGSRISQTALVYQGVREATVSIEFLTPISPAILGEASVRATLSGGKVGFSYPQDLRIRSEVAQEGSHHVLRIRALTRAEEVELLVSQGKGAALAGGLQGYASQLALLLRDEAGVSDLVQTSARAKLVQEGFLTSKTLFEGQVPAEAIRVDGDRIEIRLGQLASKPEQLAKGKRATIIVEIERGFGGKSAGQWAFRLRNQRLEH
jgi:hypothetical protein